jgi:hypothetical protein
LSVTTVTVTEAIRRVIRFRREGENDCTKIWGLRLVLVAPLLLTTVTLQAAIPGIVVRGTDYFQTVPGVSNVSGTWFDFGGPIGIVDFIWLPVGPGNTDTIVQRQADADLTMPSPIPLRIVTLSLESTSAVDISGSFFRVFVTLDPANLSRDIGTMTVMGNTATGGTFTSSLDVFFDAHFQPVTTGSPFDVLSEISLDNFGTSWTPTPPPGAVVVYGPVGDQQANCHAPVPSVRFRSFFTIAPTGSRQFFVLLVERRRCEARAY